MSSNDRAWAEAAVMNRRAREQEVMLASRDAARDGLFVAAAEILRMHMESLIEEENRLFEIIARRPKETG